MNVNVSSFLKIIDNIQQAANGHFGKGNFHREMSQRDFSWRGMSGALLWVNFLGIIFSHGKCFGGNVQGVCPDLHA